MASAGPYASPHLAPDRQPRQHPTTQFLQAGCPSCRPTNSAKTLKARPQYKEYQQEALAAIALRQSKSCQLPATRPQKRAQPQTVEVIELEACSRPTCRKLYASNNDASTVVGVIHKLATQWRSKSLYQRPWFSSNLGALLSSCGPKG